MSHYKSNLRDLEFNLFEMNGLDEILGTAPYDDIDIDTARGILAEVNRLATGVLAESFVEGDRVAPVFDSRAGSVTVPAGVRKSYQAWMDSGFENIFLDPEFGGQSAPPSLAWAVGELAMSANPNAYMMVLGPAFAQILWRIGTPLQRRLAELALERQWAATMVLTEPDAGSDVGAGRTTALAQSDGSWHIEGVKRFITAGEHDLSENIFHLVLARPSGGLPGTKGLSLFLVPKFLVDVESGELGARNGVYATNVEKKMGLKSSATCELTFGERHPAVGFLVGDVHDGIKQMFLVVERARMVVGVKATGTLSTGYLNALEYAHNRLQGPDLTRRGQASAPRVAIIKHPDVRRSLLLQKSYAEGLRALYMLAASFQDQVRLKANLGEDFSLSASVNDLLLPLVKGLCSERAYSILGQESLQTLGGSGFLQDYPIEQYVRDAKIDTLYEGTTAIQGLDFFFRKIRRDGGRAWSTLVEMIDQFTTESDNADHLQSVRAQVKQARDDVTAIVALLNSWSDDAEHDEKQIYRVGLNTTTLLYAAGDLVVAWQLGKQAAVALAALDVIPLAADDANFYRGKIAAAQFFSRTVLPRLAADRTSTEATSLEIMMTPESAF